MSGVEARMTEDDSTTIDYKTLMKLVAGAKKVHLYDVAVAIQAIAVGRQIEQVDLDSFEASSLMAVICDAAWRAHKNPVEPIAHAPAITTDPA